MKRLVSRNFLASLMVAGLGSLAPGDLQAQGKVEEDVIARILAAEIPRGQGSSDRLAAKEKVVLAALLRQGPAFTPAGSPTLEQPFPRWPACRREAPTYLRELRRASLARQLAGPPPRPRGVHYDIPLAHHALVETYLEHFTGAGRWYFARWLARADRYVPLMQPILRAHGLPEDLVYLAMVESGFSAKAYSRARAAGFWQFIGSTGRLYRLRQDNWVDERRDFVRSTHGAARYLAKLYRDFDDWHLAWAAYNAGEGRIRRALAKTGTGDFWSLIEHRGIVAKETRHYVPKVIAAAIVAKDRRRYRFHRVQSLAPLEYDEVSVPGATSLQRVATKLGTTLAALRELNPALLHNITPPGRRYPLRVPKEKGAQLAAWLSAPRSKRLAYTRHRVRPGETLYGIAKHYGVAVAAIDDINGIDSPRRLRPGSRLIIPNLASQAAQTPTKRPAKQARGATVKERAAGALGGHHVVASGETLWTIAQRYGVSVATLKKWNGRSGDALFAGEVLRVHSDG